MLKHIKLTPFPYFLCLVSSRCSVTVKGMLSILDLLTMFLPSPQPPYWMARIKFMPLVTSPRSVFQWLEHQVTLDLSFCLALLDVFLGLFFFRPSSWDALCLCCFVGCSLVVVVMGLLSSCGVRTSHHGSFFCCETHTLGGRASVVAARGLRNCS